MLSLKKIKSRSSVLKRVALPNAYLGTNIINTMSTEIPDEPNEYSETPSIQIIKYSDGTYAISIYNNNVGYKSITIKNISFDLKILSSDYYYNYIRYEFINPDTSIKELLKNPELFTENTGVFSVYISKTNNFYSIS